MEKKTRRLRELLNLGQLQKAFDCLLPLVTTQPSDLRVGPEDSLRILKGVGMTGFQRLHLKNNL